MVLPVLLLVVMVVVVEERRRFREPRSTFNHLRSITSAEVMAASSCRGRIGVVRFPSSLWRSRFVLLSPRLTLATSFSLLDSSLTSSMLVYTFASPFVHVLSGYCVQGIVGQALSKFARDCAPFEAHLIDQVLMKMIPWATLAACCCSFYYRSEFTMANATSTIHVTCRKRLHVYLLLMPHSKTQTYFANLFVIYCEA